jgi:hypothetical protein
VRAAIYQNHLALDYFLAGEGGVCSKFNWLDSCFHIYDNGQVVTEISTNIRKMADIPVQVWKGWDPNSLVDGSLPGQIQKPDRRTGSSLRSV